MIAATELLIVATFAEATRILPHMRRGVCGVAVAAALILTAHSLGTATAQTTDPQETLEGSRRERVERDQRLERDAAEQQQRDKEIQARQEEAGRAPDPAIVRGAEGPR